jgi:hypothetical protein
MQHNKFRKLKRFAKFKRFVTKTRLYIKLKQWSTKPVELKDREITILEILTAHLLDRKSQLAVAPITGNRYIVSSDESLHIVLTPINVVISTQQYYYDVRLGSDAARIIYAKFDRIMESRCKRTEASITENMMTSLQAISDAAPKSGK